MFGWLYRQREVTCPDGTKRFVYADLDRAFPYYLKDASMAAKASVEGLEKVQGTLDASYAAQIRHVLVQLDQKSGSIQSHFRAAYVAYSAEPCGGIEKLNTAIEQIRQDEQALRAAELAINQLVALLSIRGLRGGVLDPALAQGVTDQLARVLAALNRPRTTAVLAEGMGQVETNVMEWQLG